jgi:peptide/nickel transport system substrate-binding protein
VRSFARPLSAVLAIALTLTTSACADAHQAHDGSAAATYRPVVGDVSGRTPVRKIQLLTKTEAEDPRWFEEARLIVESWQRAGIPTELLALRGVEVVRHAFTSKNFDASLLVYGATPDRIDPDSMLSKFTSARAGVSGTNISGYRNAQYDAVYDAQQLAMNEAHRVAAVKKAQKLLYEQQPARPFAYPVVGGAYRSDRWDGIQQALGYPVFNIWNSIRAVPKTGKRTLVVGTVSEPRSLNPVALESPAAHQMLSHIYDSLVRIGPDGELRSWAAKSVKVDGARARAKLRSGMRFSDGHPVTASDVAFTIRYLIDKKSPLFAPKLTAVRDVRADGDSVEITLARPSPAFVPTVLTQLPILPKHVWEKVANPAKFVNNAPVGSGPFVFAGRKLGAELRLTPNKEHFSAPKIDGLVMIVLGNFDAEVGGLAQGDLDMLGDVQNVAQLAAVRGKSGITVLSAESIGWAGLHYNMRKEPFDDRHFRRALSLLIPVHDIIDAVLDGHGKPAGSPIASSLTKWHDPSLRPFPYDTRAAMKELREAGYVFDRRGVLYYPTARDDKRVRDNDLPP